MYWKPCPECGAREGFVFNFEHVRCPKCGYTVPVNEDNLGNFFAREWNYAVTHTFTLPS